MALDPNQFEVLDDKPTTEGRYELLDDAPKAPDLSKVKLSPYEQADLSGGNREDYNVSVPPSLNPDYDFARETQGGLAGLAGKSLSALQQDVVEPAAHYFNKIPGSPLWGLERAIKQETGYEPKPGESIFPPQWLPLADEKEQGVIPELTRAVKGFTTEGSLATLPLAEFKPVQAYYLAQSGGALPGQLEKLAESKTPEETRSAITSLGVNLGLAGLMAHGMTRSAPAVEPPVQGPPTLGRFMRMPEGAEPPLSVERFEPLDTQSGSPISPQDLLERQSRRPTLPETPEPEIKTHNLDALEGDQNATETRTQPEGNQPEHPGDGGERPPPQPGSGSGTAQRPPEETPPNEPSAPTGDARGGNDKEVSQVSQPISDFISQHQANERLSTEDANKAGLSARNVSDLDALAEAWKKSKALANESLKKARENPADMMKHLQEAQSRTPAQILREAIETATNTGSHVEGEGSTIKTKLGERPLDWKNHPEVADWLLSNADSLGIKLPDELKSKTAEIIGMGGAKYGELGPSETEGREQFGIRQSNREARARAGETVEVESGEGTNPPDSIAHGRELLSKGADPEAILSQFEKTRRFSSDDIAIVRAHGERLQQEARDIEQRFGTDSPEFRDAFDRLADWDVRSKAMQTEWSKSGVAQQGVTDIDTGSFVGLQREFTKSTGKKFTPEQAEGAKKQADSVNKAADEVEGARNELFDELDKSSGDAKDLTEAERRALAAANKTVREAAARKAKAESDARVAQSARDKKASLDAAKREQSAIDAANKVVRENAARLAKLAQQENVLKADTSAYAWKKAKEYIEKGITNFDDIRNKLATDLGMSVDKVTSALAKTKRAKQLTDDLWRKQQEYRRLDQQAKTWLANQQMPWLMKALRAIPRAVFAAKVFGHGTVALGTHAPMVAFQPTYWKSYISDFGKMYGMVFNRAFHENQIQQLVRRPNFTVAQRAGLVNDPFQHEDYNTPEIANYISKIPGIGLAVKAGDRGYSVLKILRQDMFDQQWNKLPRTQQIPEVAKAISDGINHATGVIRGKAPKGSNIALFAPRLEASRAAWLIVDPLKSAHTFLDWKNASEGDKMFAVNQLKEKAWVVGTMLSLLALNEGFLEATGSSQRINTTDPMKKDWMKFKVAGMNIGYGNAMLSMARLPARLYRIRESDGGKLKNLVYPDEDTYSVLGEYGRSQLSPFASLASTLWFKSDWQNRPLPNSNRPVPKRLRAQGVRPYTWPEFWSEQVMPIPAEEAAREVWKSGLGMTDEQMKQARKALATISIMAATGARVEDDTDTSHP